MAKKQLFVWDLHGVLEQGNDDAVVFVTNEVLKKHGYEKRLYPNDARKYIRCKWHELFSFLLPKEPSDKHLQLQADSFVYSYKNFDEFAHLILLNDHAFEVLEKIHQSNHDQILLSNTKHKSLEQYIETLGVNKYFPEGYYWGVNGHEKGSKTKRDVLLEYLSKNSETEEIITIGDSKREVDLASVSEKGRSYLYSHPYLSFSDCHADEKINDLRLVLKEL